MKVILKSQLKSYSNWWEKNRNNGMNLSKQLFFIVWRLCMNGRIFYITRKNGKWLIFRGVFWIEWRKGLMKRTLYLKAPIFKINCKGLCKNIGHWEDLRYRKTSTMMKKNQLWRQLLGECPNYYRIIEKQKGKNFRCSNKESKKKLKNEAKQMIVLLRINFCLILIKKQRMLKWIKN